MYFGVGIVLDGRCAAILFIDGAIYFTDGVPNGEIMDKFQSRSDRFVELTLCGLC